MPCRRSSSSWCSTNGRPAISMRALGCASVSGRIRSASPPARIATGGSGGSLDDNLRALGFEAEAHLAQPGLGQRVAQARLVLGVEQQEASAAGADQLPAQRAAPEREIIPLVDPAAGHLR